MKAGPGLGGKGGSAFFDGDNYLYIPNRKEFAGEELTYSFWIYLVSFNKEGAGDLKCPLLLKGNDDFKLKTFLRHPGIYIDEKTRKIKVFLSIKDKKDYKQVFYFLQREFGLKVLEEFLCKDGLTFLSQFLKLK